MKLLVSVLLAVTSFSVPSISLGAINLAAVSCGPDAPAEWLRPGGYCDQIGSNNSLVPPDAGDGDMDVCSAAYEGIFTGDRILVALPYIPCIDTCITYGLTDKVMFTDRLRVAGLVCAE